MKKSQRIGNAIFKMGYVITAVSVMVRYISEILSPTATYSSISGFEWLALGAMTMIMQIFLSKKRRQRTLALTGDVCFKCNNIPLTMASGINIIK